MKYYTLRELIPKEYSGFVSEQKSDNFLQSVNAYNRYISNKKEAYLIGLKDNYDKIRLAMLIVVISEKFGKKIFSSPGGPITDKTFFKEEEDVKVFCQLVRKFIKNHNGSILQISPNILYSERIANNLKKASFKELGEYIQVKWRMNLNLTKYKNYNELFSTFRSSHRQSIRYSKNRYKIEIKKLKYNELNILHDLMQESAQKHHFQSQSLQYLQEMYKSFSDKAMFVVALYDNKPVAGAMFILYGKEIVYLYSGVNRTYNKCCGSYAIQDYIIEYAINKNYANYNFYGVKPFPGDGVYEFKQGFHPDLEELLGTFILPVDFYGKIYTMTKKYQKYSNVV